MELYNKVKALTDGWKVKNGTLETQEHIELRVELKDLTYGTADYVLIWPSIRKALVADWKFIRTQSVSEPKDNLQVRIYAAGVLEAFPEIDEVEAFVVAPQINWLPDSFTFYRNDLPIIREQVEKITLECADPFKKPRACDLCGNCENISRCPEMGKVAVTVASNIGLPMPSTFAADSLAVPEDRAKAYIIAKALENWSEQIKKNTSEWLAQGNELPGHSTVTRNGNMKINDVPAAVVALRTLLDDNQILGAMSMSITKITDVVAEKEGKKNARETVENLLVGLISRGPSSTFALRKKGDKV
jgi:hypothetical protein